MGNMASLPKWAQKTITSLERRVEQAEATLRSFTDEQTKSPFWVESFDNQGRPHRNYIQARGISVRHQGVEAHVFLPCGLQGREGIEISFAPTHRTLVGDVAIIPEARNRIVLMAVTKEATND